MHHVQQAFRETRCVVVGPLCTYFWRERPRSCLCTTPLAPALLLARASTLVPLYHPH
jgi:hypothetical protein